MTCLSTTAVIVRSGGGGTAAAWATWTGDGSSSPFKLTTRWAIAPGATASTTLVPPEAQRLAVGLLMLSPCVPLLFMGEEYGETRPFPFFCSFSDAGLIEAVRRGRREEFAALAFAWGGEIPDPQARETFLAAKLDWQWSSADRAARRRLYADLLAARRRWPALRDQQHTAARAGGCRRRLQSPILWRAVRRSATGVASYSLDRAAGRQPGADRVCQSHVPPPAFAAAGLGGPGIIIEHGSPVVRRPARRRAAR